MMRLSNAGYWEQDKIMDAEMTAPMPRFDRLNRRAFVATSLGVGFTLAAGPVIADTIIHTDDKGLIAGEVKIPAPDGEIPAYRAMPATGKKFHTVLVIHEAFGVHEHIKDVCRRFAKLGYFAVSVDLFARIADMSKVTEQAQVMDILGKVSEPQAMTDLDATVAWAKGTGKADTTHLAATGFCIGGRFTWLYAEHNPALKAAVSWYGVLERPKSDLRPANPIDQVKQLHCPVLGLYGGADTIITAASIAQLKQAAAAAHKKVEFVVYDGAPHGFNADYRPSYRKEAADDGWKRLQAWFKKNGV
jgi:carboxymethylenebutenolidase